MFGSIAIGVADDISETLVIVIVILIRIWADGLSLVFSDCDVSA